MANDLARTIDRSRSIFTNLLRQLPPVDRDRHLTKHADDIQSSIDDVLADLDGAPPVSLRSRARGRPPGVSNTPMPQVPANDAGVATEPHVHDAACEHLHEAVAKAEGATVPSAVRAVLASETIGLPPKQVIAGVKLLRPETDDESVHGALHQMWRRGELAREGVHKNYRYRLVPLTSLGSGVVHMEGRGPGGETH